MIDSGWYLQGEKVKQFEANLAAYTGIKHAVSVANGLDALRLIFKAYIEMGIMQEGDEVKPGDFVFTVEGNSVSLLSSERLALNFMQRMSGIATKTHEMVKLIEGLNTA